MAAADPAPALVALDNAIAQIDLLVSRLTASSASSADVPVATQPKTAAAGSNGEIQSSEKGKAKAAKPAAQSSSASASGGENVENFDKCDIRVARVQAVEPHPVAEKLYVCQVEVAPGEVRQVVAGLRKFISQEELQGRLVCAVCNLKPAKLAGQPSQAMMLAGSHPSAEAEAGEIVKLIDPPQDAAVGDRVCIQGRPASAAPVKQLSSKVWEKVAGLLRVQGGAATYDGQALVTGAGGGITVQGLVDGRDGHLTKEGHLPTEGVIRLMNVDVPLHTDPGKDDVAVSDGLVRAAASALHVRPEHLPPSALTVVRKSFDARKVCKGFRAVLGGRESLGAACAGGAPAPVCSHHRAQVLRRPQAGLLAALVLAEAGEQVTVIERGQPVEERGRDIGALAVRHVLNPDSNFCYGEGGAGTWSDGKLTTRIGKNSQDVREVLNVLVRMGAPERILVDGRPHLGTDRLVRILQQFRAYLLGLGVEIRFGTVVEDLEVRNGRVAGVRVRPAGSAVGSGAEGRSVIAADRVLLGVGHSARAVFDMLLSHNVLLSPKDFAVGFRIEHPQREINAIRVRLSRLFDMLLLGVGHSARAVFDMLLSHNVRLSPKDFAVGFRIEHPQREINAIRGSMDVEAAVARGKGPIPVADYSLAGQFSPTASSTSRGQQERSCYSFCMCPGGQVVCTSVSADELCLNGMSFSHRSSLWANAALVSSVSSAAGDFDEFTREHGALAGMEYQVCWSGF
ncbi:unnamed protein product [Closterium sp. Yama58-4]|nr:unnamed protein product [Closterium sp. Yama58-4]